MSDDLKKRLLDWGMWDEGDINDTREEAHAYIKELEAAIRNTKYLLEMHAAYSDAGCRVLIKKALATLKGTTNE